MRRLALVLSLFAILASAGPAQAANKWFDGGIQRSYITNCASVIFGSPYTEEGAWNWVGFYSDENNFPDAGQVFYIHTVFAAVGNSCSGQYARPEISLPSGVQLAISQQTPVFCYAFDIQSGQSSQKPAACPQQASQGSYGGQYGFNCNPNDTGNCHSSGVFPVPQGKGWELQIPVVSNRQLRGTLASPCDCLHGFTKMLDGNSSPVLNPNAGLVNDPPPAGGGGGGGGGTTPGTGGGTTPGTGGGGGTGSGGGGSTTGGGGTGTTTTTPSTENTSAPTFSSLGAPSSYSGRRLARSGLTITVQLGSGGSRVDAKLTGPGGVVLARGVKLSAGPGKASVKLRATKKGARLLRRGRRMRARLRVTVTPPVGAKSAKSKTLTLKR